jgi:hypothetical protein
VKGVPVKGNMRIAEGTAIATFNTPAHYEGQAAIYVSQDDTGIQVLEEIPVAAALGRQGIFPDQAERTEPDSPTGS